MQKTKVTKRIYEAAKILFKGGATAKEVAEYLEIGSSTAQRIKAAETYEEYVQATSAGVFSVKAIKAKETAEKQHETKETPRYNVTIQATHYMEQELRKANELLTGISAKLAFIVDELTK